ncbi:MAG: MutT-like protein [Alphaproteobacteria bacterium]|nr:MutT-like protein [Alphaproteobacteria bacterium]
MPIDGRFFLACMATYIVLKDKNDKIFMMRRKNTSWGDGLYGLPAGRVERYETMLECAIRELKEETGVDVQPEDMKLFLVENRFTGVPDDIQPDWIDFFYIAEKWQGEPYIAEPDKCDHADWYALDDTSIDIVPNVRDAFNYLKMNKLSYCLYSPEYNFLNQKAA